MSRRKRKSSSGKGELVSENREDPLRSTLIVIVHFVVRALCDVTNPQLDLKERSAFALTPVRLSDVKHLHGERAPAIGPLRFHFDPGIARLLWSEREQVTKRW